MGETLWASVRKTRIYPNSTPPPAGLLVVTIMLGIKKRDLGSLGRGTFVPQFPPGAAMKIEMGERHRH